MSSHHHKDKREGAQALMELWDMFLRHRWRFVLPVFLVVTAVLAVSLALPRKYRATALFERRNDLVLTEMTSRGATRSFQDPRQSLTEALAGLPAIDELLAEEWPGITERRLVSPHVTRAELRDDLRRRVSVHFDISTPELDRVRIEYTASSPELSKIVTNGLVRRYITRTRAQMEARLRESSDFFRAEVDRHREVIELLENGILEFEIANGDLLPDSPNNVQQQIASIGEDLSNVQRMRDAATLRVEGLRQSLADTPATVATSVTGKNPDLDRLAAKRRGLAEDLHEATAVMGMTDKHPDVLALHQAIAAVDAEAATLEQEIVTQKQTTTNPKRSELELSLTSALAEQKAYEDQLVAMRAHLERLSAQTGSLFEVRSKHRKLNRDLEETHRQLAFWEDNLRRVEMALAAESGNRGVQLDFIQPAEAGTLPVSPDLKQVVAAAIFLGLVGGALSLVHAHRSDDTFHDGETMARKIDLPLFGAVSEIVTTRHRHARWMRNAVLYPGAGLAMSAVVIGLVSILYIDLEDPAALSRLRTRIMGAADVAAPDAAALPRRHDETTAQATTP